MGIKPLLPSLREKKRYVAFEVISNSKIAFHDFSRALWNSLLGFIGEFGAANAGVIAVANTYNPQLQRGLIRVNNRFVDYLKSALALISTVGEQSVIVRVIGVSGVLKKAQKKYEVA